jgi:hypothetical protein
VRSFYRVVLSRTASIVIGLFGLIGMIGVLMAPLYGRAIDNLAPWYMSLVSTVLLLATKALYLGAAGLTIAVPVLVTVGLDVARQCQQIALAARVFAIEDGMRARLNAVSIFSVRVRVRRVSAGVVYF